MVTSISGFGRLVPALLTRMLNGSAEAIAFCIADKSLTSSTSASACCPRAQIAAAACSISDLVRAASVTCAPAPASADAAASPMPRPAPVTSARLPSRRKDGVAARSGEVTTEALAPDCCRSGAPSLRALRIGHIAAAVATDADIGLLGMRDEAFQHAQPRTRLADGRACLVGQHFLIGAGLQKLPHPQPTGITRRLLGRQRVIGADHLISVGNIGARAEEQGAVIFHGVEKVIRIARHHLHVLRSNTIGLAPHFRLV